MSKPTVFPSLDYTQERLRKLTGLGVVDRFRPQKPDGGSYPYHYLLAQLGVEVVAAQRGQDLPRKDQARKRRWHLTYRANLPHLGTNQVFTDLAGYARTHPGCELARWWPASRCQGMGAFALPGDDVHVHADNDFYARAEHVLIGAIERAQAQRDTTADDRHAELTAITNQIATTEAAIVKYHTAFENGTMDDLTAGPRIRDLRRQLAQLHARHGDLEADLATQPETP